MSPTSCCCGARCWRKYFFEKRLGLSDPSRSKTALIYGDAMHWGLPWCYQGTPESLKIAIEAFGKRWGDTKGDDARNPGRAALSLGYFMQTHNPSVCPYTVFKVPSTVKVVEEERASEWEVPFALDVGCPIPVVGKIDAVGRGKHNNKIWAVEFKTSYEESDRLLLGFVLNPQILTYELALLTMVPGEPVGGTFLEVILTSKYKFQTCTQPIEFNENSIDILLYWYKQWYHEFSIRENMFLETVLVDSFEPQISHCTTYSGFGMPGYLCDYQRICTRPVDEWEDIFGLYDVSPERPFILEE